MAYESDDSPSLAKRIVVTLPEGFHLPPTALLERLASRFAADVRAPLSKPARWALLLAPGLVTTLSGPRWWLLPSLALYLVGLAIGAALRERRRVHRLSREALAPPET